MNKKEFTELMGTLNSGKVTDCGSPLSDVQKINVSTQADIAYQLTRIADQGGTKLNRTIEDERELARNQPCGCITCTCYSTEKCFGCGAKSCGKPYCVFKTSKGMVFADPDDTPHACGLRTAVERGQKTLEKYIHGGLNGLDEAEHVIVDTHVILDEALSAHPPTADKPALSASPCKGDTRFKCGNCGLDAVNPDTERCEECDTAHPGLDRGTEQFIANTIKEAEEMITAKGDALAKEVEKFLSHSRNGWIEYPVDSLKSALDKYRKEGQ